MIKLVKGVVTLIKLLIILGILCFVYHRIELKKEDDLFKTTGQIVEVNNHNLNVFISGNKESEVTLVFMAGGGTASPTLDFKTLYSLFENEYQIAVVEKDGYGFSDVSGSSRDIEVMLLETRMSLEKAGISQKNYILFPHSLSAIEALYWANKYPEEVKGIVGLDPAVPASYDEMKTNPFFLQIAHYASFIGITRLIPYFVNNSSAIKDGNLTAEEQKLYKIISYRRTITKPMIEEAKIIKENAKKLSAIDNTDIPMLFFISNGEGTSYEKDEWQKFGIDYISQKENGQYVILDCSHYVHNIEYQKIFTDSSKFIKNIINK